MTVTIQRGLPGVAPDAIAGNIKDRVRVILEQHPDARDDYRLVQYYYWREFCALHSVAPDLERFRDWYTDVVSAKTLLQRAQEVQRENLHLRPSPRIRELRRAQARQGPIV